MRINATKLSALLLSGLLIGCPLTSEYKIEVTNNSKNQPLSPMTLVTSTKPNYVFELGKPASVALEKIAEGGDNSMLLTDASSELFNVEVAKSGDSLILPGATDSMTITRLNTSAKFLSLVSMLTNTNDGFIGEHVDLSKLDVGDSKTINAVAWDAGTEPNTETPESLVSSEGFNPSRDGDVNFVHTHPGVISSQDGLQGSALLADARFSSPVARITITRIK